jgi:signal transduction histidine kinase
MSIVKEIIELHHGHITIESNLGQGTRISLSLPQVQPK